MTHNEAIKILDRHKEGEHYSLITVNHALQLTGDLSGNIEILCGVGAEARMESLCLERNSGHGQ